MESPRATRRALLRLALVAGATGAFATARPARADEAAATLRMMRIRHRTTLVEMGGRRVLVDPCFAADLGAGILWSAEPPALEPEETGEVDLLLVSSSEPGAFDGSSTRRLHGRDAFCLVADERTATVLRHQGYRRVRVVQAGDVVDAGGVVVRASPSEGLLGGRAVGFHLEHAGRTWWHAGAPPPVDVADGAPRFAREHTAEVIAVSAGGLAFAGTPRTLDHEDALLLAGLAKARYAVLLDDDVRPSRVGGLVLAARPGSRRAPAGVKVRLVVVEPGQWVRVLPG